MKRALVIIPTYNERDTLPAVIDAVLKHQKFDILVIDDSSPDGTVSVIREIMKREKGVFLIERAGKLGLGTAYIEGFKWGLERGYDYFIEMDADGSHDPDALPAFIPRMNEDYGLIIGSRYMGGSISVVGWGFKRLMLSKFGNFYAAWILGLRLTDLTSGFRCYSRKALESIDLDEVHSTGYGFQIEMAYRIGLAGLSICEMPIIFYERAYGASKMSGEIIREAVSLPWRLRLRQILPSDRNAAFADLKYRLRTVIGFASFIIGIFGSLRVGWWLSAERDIVEVIHEFKMSLPDWAWVAMRIGLAGISGLFFLGLLLALAILIFSGGSRK